MDTNLKDNKEARELASHDRFSSRESAEILAEACRILEETPDKIEALRNFSKLNNP